jgi:tripeptidyl-peptidase-1
MNWSVTFTRVSNWRIYAPLTRILIFASVSDPYHSRYGQHLSHEEVNALVKPKDEALELVHEWLLSNGVNKFDYSPSKDWINIRISVEEAENLLAAEYSVYAHEDGTELARTTKWSLPSHLHEHIDTVQPTTSFMRTKANLPNPAPPSTVNVTEVYQPPGYVPPTDPALIKACSINGTTPTCCKFITDFSCSQHTLSYWAFPYNWGVR